MKIAKFKPTHEQLKLRATYKSSSGNYYLYKSGVIGSIAKTLGNNKTEQELIANQIADCVNMHEMLIDALKTIQQYHGDILLPIIKVSLKSLLKNQ